MSGLTIKHIPVASSNIHSIGYDADSKILEVKFKPSKKGEAGLLYAYAPVEPDTFTALLNAPSKGTFLHVHIKSDTRIAARKL